MRNAWHITGGKGSRPRSVVACACWMSVCLGGELCGMGRFRKAVLVRQMGPISKRGRRGLGRRDPRWCRPLPALSREGRRWPPWHWRSRCCERVSGVSFPAVGPTPAPPRQASPGGSGCHFPVSLSRPAASPPLQRWRTIGRSQPRCPALAGRRQLL